MNVGAVFALHNGAWSRLCLPSKLRYWSSRGRLDRDGGNTGGIMTADRPLLLVKCI